VAALCEVAPRRSTYDCTLLNTMPYVNKAYVGVGLAASRATSAGRGHPSLVESQLPLAQADEARTTQHDVI
jgi:hypothetical protein